MKFYLSQIEKLLDAIKQKKIRGVLLYGPDRGYVNLICGLIIKNCDFIKVSFEYPKFIALGVETYINSRNFFAKREFIKITALKSSIEPSLRIILNSDFFHFVAFVAEELPANSEVRKFFDASNHLASLGCYYDEEGNVEKIILKKCHKADKEIALDAIERLKTDLRGDHNLIISELDKLLYFTHDKNSITLDDVVKAITPDHLASSDDLCIYFADCETEKFFYEVNKLLQLGTNPVLLIRALIRYYLNLYEVLTKTQRQNLNIDIAIKSLSPPIFFKYVSSFKQIVSNMSFSKVTETLEHLQQAELELKTHPAGYDVFNQLYLAMLKIKQ